MKSLFWHISVFLNAFILPVAGLLGIFWIYGVVTGVFSRCNLGCIGIGIWIVVAAGIAELLLFFPLVNYFSRMRNHPIGSRFIYYTALLYIVIVSVLGITYGMLILFPKL